MLKLFTEYCRRSKCSLTDVAAAQKVTHTERLRAINVSDGSLTHSKGVCDLY